MPHALKDKLKIKLDELLRDKIIEKVNEYSEWVHYMVIVQKKDKTKSLRICIDPNELNKNIKEKHTLMPTFDEVAAKLYNVKYFSNESSYQKQ